MKKKFKLNEMYAIAMLNIDYIDIAGSYSEQDHLYLHIDKSKLPTPTWICRDNALEFYLYVMAMKIMFDDYMQWIPEDEFNDYEYYIIYEINPPKEGIYAANKINTFAIKHDDKMIENNGLDFLRSVLDIAEYEEYPDSQMLHNIYDKFVADVEKKFSRKLARAHKAV